MNTDFVRADTTNLPNVDMFMIMEYMKLSDKHNVAEIRGAKALKSSRESYVDNAVGYVEVKRTGNLCEVRAKVVPEHKIGSKYYTVTISIQNEETILDASCADCAAAAGGCKHTLVLLYWLQKRSAEPSPTSVQCYWVKPNLKSAQQEVILAANIYEGETLPIGPKDPEILRKFRAEANKHSGCETSLIQMMDANRGERLSDFCLFDMAIDFGLKENDRSYENFRKFNDAKIPRVKNKIFCETLGQVNSKLWHCMRQARITGSILYEVASCKTPDGSLVEEMLGGYKKIETKAMKSGKLLEKDILKKIGEEFEENIRESGFLLINSVFGASPDGIMEDYVVEIKCPSTDKTKKNYINNGKLSNKCMSQVQLEMLAADKKKCLFCLADPKFEENSKIKTYIVEYDDDYIQKIMTAAESFWKMNIFPKLMNSAL